jgi:hypothetical protein
MTADTAARVNNRIKRLSTLSAAQLIDQWHRTFRSEAPAWPPDLLRRAIANRWQEAVLGGLSPDISSQIDRLVRDWERAARNQTRVGIRYVRHWGGEVHSVLAVESGFEYRGTIYRSLSAVAELITGTHRSGPHFFGVAR